MATDRAQVASRMAARRELGQLAREPAGFAARLRAARQMRIEIAWPGTDITMGLELLSERDRMAAAQAAREELTKRGIDHGKPAPAHAEELGAEVWVQIIGRALFESAQPDAPRLFASVDEFRAEVRAAELDVLSDEYVALERERSPKLEEISREAIAEFEAAVKKKDVSRWNAIASAMPRSSLRTLADRLASSLSSTSSSTPSDDEP